MRTTRTLPPTADTDGLGARVPEEPTGAAAPAGRRGLLGAVVDAGWRVWAIRAVLAVAVLGSWQLVADLRWIKPLFIGSPSGIAEALVHLPAHVYTVDLTTTLSETAIAFVAGALAGAVLGGLMARLRSFDRAVAPVFSALNSTPRIAFAPLFVLWFGLGQLSKVALAFTLVVFIVAANTRAALTGLDRDVLLLARSLGAREWERLALFVLPGGLPTVIAGLELGVAYSFLGTVAGEIMGGEHGLGVVLNLDANTFRTDDFFAVMLVLLVVAAVVVGAVRLAGARLTRWVRIEMREGPAA
jgi:NitT/TauT family transport system permease protein